MTKYIDLQGCLKVETKQLMPAENEAKLEAKAKTNQTGYTKEFKESADE